jgi:hypothetical protein
LHRAVHSTGGPKAVAPSWSGPQSSYGTTWTSRRASKGHWRCSPSGHRWRVRTDQRSILNGQSGRKKFLRVSGLILLTRESEQRDFGRPQGRRRRWKWQFQPIPVRLPTRAVRGVGAERPVECPTAWRRGSTGHTVGWTQPIWRP